MPTGNNILGDLCNQIPTNLTSISTAQLKVEKFNFRHANQYHKLSNKIPEKKKKKNLLNNLSHTQSTR